MRSPFPSELEEYRHTIESYAKGYGLDFFPVIFEILDWKEINMVAAYGGFPNRYPHWRFGMEYEQLSKSYSYGLSKIYEMVINNDPCYAYLLHSNTQMDQKLVMAHVYGHSDFFKNNGYFGHTNRKMMDLMANHKTRVKRYVDKFGQEEVENFIDTCLTIENLIDTHRPFIKRNKERGDDLMAGDEDGRMVQKLKSKDYMDKFINPKEFLEEQKQKIADIRLQEKNFPENPDRDVLHFLLEHAPLERWQRDVLGIIREEAYYFLPQMQTKIMNEGWASYWHSKIMTEKILSPGEFIDYADHHAGTLASAPGRLNPYKIGIELFRDIEDRWNKGKFGKEFDECDDMVERKRWNKNLGLGRQKVFEVRKIFSDLNFIDTFLTQDFCRDHNLFVYAFNNTKETFEITSREFKQVKEKLLFSLTNRGQPFIDVTNANYQNRGELYLMHHHDGIDLRQDYAQETLKNLFSIWKRPVAIETVAEGKEKIFYYDGKNYQELGKNKEV